MKKFISGFLCAVLLFCLIGTAVAVTGQKSALLDYLDIKVTLNGGTVTPKDANGNTVEPFAIDGTTYLPLRAVSSALGLGVDWDQATHTVKLTSANTTAPSTAAAAGRQHKTGTVGDYYIEIKSATLTTDWEGNKAIGVIFSWTNQSSETLSAGAALNYQAFQGGIELDHSFAASGSKYADDNLYKDVRPGATLEVAVVYKLRDTDSAVEVEFSSSSDYTNSPSVVYSSFALS